MIRGEYAEAEVFFEQSLAIVREYQGESHTSVAMLLFSLGELDRVRSTARKLKGSATDHGIHTIAELANVLERAARTDDRASIQRVVDELEQYVEHVQVTYRRPFERKLGQAG